MIQEVQPIYMKVKILITSFKMTTRDNRICIKLIVDIKKLKIDKKDTKDELKK